MTGQCVLVLRHVIHEETNKKKLNAQVDEGMKYKGEFMTYDSPLGASIL